MTDKVSNRRGRAQQEKETEVSTNSDGQEDVKTEETAEKAAKTTKTAAPEGTLAPVAYAKHLSELKGEEVRPQIVYGYLKNMKDFPQQDRGEGVVPRIVIPTEEADAFLSAKASAKAEKDAKKAAEAEAAAQPAEANA
jgi:hypothetical protein